MHLTQVIYIFHRMWCSKKCLILTTLSVFFYYYFLLCILFCHRLKPLMDYRNIRFKVFEKYNNNQIVFDSLLTCGKTNNTNFSEKTVGNATMEANRSKSNSSDKAIIFYGQNYTSASPNILLEVKFI